MSQINKKQSTIKLKDQDAVKYQELTDAELEIICGGGNLIGRNRGK